MWKTISKHCDRIGLTALTMQPAQNTVFSPLSACFALAMVAGGASNTAAKELETLLGAPVDRLGPEFQQMAATLRAYEIDPASIKGDKLPERAGVHRANQVVISPSFTPVETYLEKTRATFNATIATADLSSPQGKQLLDRWVNEHTGGRIKRSAIEPSRDLALVLQDAIFFAAAWTKPFVAGQEKETFYNADGTKSQVSMMSDTRQVHYANVDAWQAVKIPYGLKRTNSEFSAVFVLPPAGTAPSKTDGTLAFSSEIQSRLLGALKPSTVLVAMPKLKLSTKTDLKPLLIKLGAPSIFDHNTRPLEGIAGSSSLEVSQAKQQAMLDVTEQGTVAAAVTEMGMVRMMDPVPEATVVLDRPYVMLIVHEPSSTTLFQAVIRKL